MHVQFNTVGPTESPSAQNALTCATPDRRGGLQRLEYRVGEFIDITYGDKRRTITRDFRNAGGIARNERHPRSKRFKCGEAKTFVGRRIHCDVRFAVKAPKGAFRNGT